MLSIFKLSSSKQAESYYQKADYYTKGEDGVDVQSRWLGSGARDLGLEGAVDSERFKALLDGKVDDNTQLGAKRNGKIEHTPGWDLTFSAPKSVSVLALVSGDRDLLQAHHASVERMAQLIEERYLKSRRNFGAGNVEGISLKNMVAAAFTHTTSRKLDPQLHTHMVLMNMGKDAQGKDMSLYTLDLFKDKMFLGQMYRNELAKRVQELGYGIDYDDQKGTFEIAGVNKELLDEFSQRRKEVEATAEAFGYEGGKEMEKAALGSRDAKKDVPKEDVIDVWNTKLIDRGYTPERLIDEAKRHAPARVEPLQASPYYAGILSTKPERGSLPTDPFDLALKITSHYESVFSYKDIVQRALLISGGRQTIDDVDRKLADKVRTKEVVRSQDKPGLFTTPEGIRRESYILDLLGHGRNMHQRIASQAKIEELLSENGSFTEGQARSFSDLLSSHDRYVGLQGYAGVGKTYMMNPFIKAAESAGYSVRGFAPNGTQAEQLEKETGLNSNTLKSHIMRLETGRFEPEKNELWIVDEAGMVNTKDMADLLTHAHRNEARVVFSGDIKQLGAIEAGNPFDLFMKKGMEYTINDSILRQRDGSQLKDGIQYLIDGKTEKAFRKLDKDILESEKPVDDIVKQYLAKEDLSFKDVALIVPDITTRDKVNEALRKDFRQRGMLSGDDVRLTNLLPSKIDGPMKRESQFYKPGQYVRFNSSYKSLGVDSKSYYEVSKVLDGVVYLKNGNQTIQWDPKKVAGGDRSTSTYVKRSADYAVGDRIRWKDKNDEHELKNGHLGTIVKLDSKAMTVAFGEKQVSFDFSKLNAKHFQHAYAQTVYSIQGQTYKEALMLAESWRRNLINQKSFYVSISRAKETATIFTEDKTKLERAIDERLGYKGNSHDIISEQQEKEFKFSKESRDKSNDPSFDYIHGTSKHSFGKDQHKPGRDVEPPQQKNTIVRDKQLDF